MIEKLKRMVLDDSTELLRANKVRIAMLIANLRQEMVQEEEDR